MHFCSSSATGKRLNIIPRLRSAAISFRRRCENTCGLLSTQMLDIFHKKISILKNVSSFDFVSLWPTSIPSMVCVYVWNLILFSMFSSRFQRTYSRISESVYMAVCAMQTINWCRHTADEPASHRQAVEPTTNHQTSCARTHQFQILNYWTGSHLVGSFIQRTMLPFRWQFTFSHISLAIATAAATVVTPIGIFPRSSLVRFNSIGV